MTDEGQQYTVDKARRHGWTSLDEDLDPERREILDRWVAGEVVADIGCGGGGYVAYLRGQGKTAYGVDLSSEMMGHAQTRWERPGWFVRGSALQVPLTDGAVDTAILYDIIEHLDDDLAAVREAARVARRRVIVAVPHTDARLRRAALLPYHFEDVTHRRTYDEADVARLGEALGWTVAATFGHLALDLHGLFVDLFQPGEHPALLRPVYGKMLHRVGLARIPTAVCGVFDRP